MASILERRILFALTMIIVTVAFSYLTYVYWNILDIAQKVQLGVFLATAFSVVSFVAFSILDKYIEGPDLEILHVPGDEIFSPQLTLFLIPVGQNAPTEQRETRFLRVLVHNRGSRTAQRCLARLELVQRPPGNHILARDEKTLVWPDVPDFPNIPPQAQFPVNVAFSARDLAVPLPGACDGFMRAWTCTREALGSPNTRAQDALCLGRYKLRLSVYSDNSSPVHKNIVVNVTAVWNELSMEIDDC
jgi:hypothetical protein